MAVNYINNKDFLKALKEYKAVCEASSEGEHQRMPDYIGQCFLQIADRLSRKPIFASYSFRDDMVSYAVENCIKYHSNFKTEISDNPFAYFTQIVYNAFLRKITDEKKQLYIKYKSTQQVGILDENDLLDDDNDGRWSGQFEVYSNITDFINTFEEAKAKKKAKKKKVGLEKFIQSEPNE